MDEANKGSDNNSGKEEQDPKDDLFERAKKFADQAEGYAAKASAKIKESEVFEKLTDALKKASAYMDEKSEEFNKSDLAEKLENIKEKTVKETEKYISEAKKAGKKMADDLDEAFDLLKEKGRKKKDNG
jgi:hypothetical protein